MPENVGSNELGERLLLNGSVPAVWQIILVVQMFEGLFHMSAFSYFRCSVEFVILLPLAFAALI